MVLLLHLLQITQIKPAPPESRYHLHILNPLGSVLSLLWTRRASWHLYLCSGTSGGPGILALALWEPETAGGWARHSGLQNELYPSGQWGQMADRHGWMTEGNPLSLRDYKE